MLRNARYEPTERRRGGCRPGRRAYRTGYVLARRTEEQAAREDAVAGQLGVFRALLPKRLKELSKIPDPRQPKKVKHKLTVVLLYGVLS